MQCPYCREEIIDGAVKCKHCGSILSETALVLSPQTADFGAIFTRTLDLWKNNLTDLIVLTLVFLLVCWIPIANIGFIAGYVRSLTKVSRGDGRVQVGDLFTAWDCFGNLFVYLMLYLVAAVTLHFVPFIGSLASLVLSFMAVPGIYAVIDRNFAPIDAFKWCIETIQSDFVNWLLAYIIGSVIVIAGFMFIMIGAILTVPLGQLLIIQQYEHTRPD